ncbi:hypothetical protein CEXT_418751 [Caerostris extrusa]|uniref:Uncharacterized protein n=1 Tax=Caerostris extrusa TaxID=172846 RepID=A0AAV4TD65_CAEEX|nr:hypothetical protein CEXT_418751 [Caerostris extrusa]
MLQGIQQNVTFKYMDAFWTEQNRGCRHRYDRSEIVQLRTPASAPGLFACCAPSQMTTGRNWGFVSQTTHLWPAEKQPNSEECHATLHFGAKGGGGDIFVLFSLLECPDKTSSYMI